MFFIAVVKSCLVAHVSAEMHSRSVRLKDGNASQPNSHIPERGAKTNSLTKQNENVADQPNNEDT